MWDYSIIFDFLLAMKIQKKQATFWFCFLLWTIPVCAQQYPFQTIGLADGLPSTNLTDLLQDQRGYYWLASEGAGLLRYDGYTFVPVSNNMPVPFLFIYSLAEDEQGNIWFGSEKGLVQFNGLRFKEFSPLTESPIACLLPMAEGIVWALTRKGTLLKVEGDSLRVVPGPGNFTALAGFKDTVYVGGQTGLYRVDTQTVQLDSIPVMAMRANEQMLALARENGLEIKFPDGTGRTLLRNKRMTALSLGQNKVAATDGSSWFLHQVNGNTTELTSEHLLPDQKYGSLYFDKLDVLWGLGNENLTQLGQFASVLHQSDPPIAVSAVVEYRGTQMAASPNQLWKVNADQALEPVTSPDFGTVQALSVYKDALYLGTERGLYRYNGQSFSKLRLGTQPSEFIFSLLAANEALWIGTGSGLLKLSENGLSDEQKKHNLPASTVFGISQSPEGAIWFATYFNGFYRYKDGEWLLRADRAFNLGIDSLQVNAFAAATDESLWLSTANEGLIRAGEEGKVQISGSRLDFAEITSLQLSDNYLWAGSNKGLFKIYPDPQHSRAFLVNLLQKNEGFTGGACTNNALYIGTSGILAGTEKGLQQLSYEDLSPPKKLMLALTEIELFYGDVQGIAQYAKDTLPFSQVPFQLDLPYNLNFVSLALAGIHPLLNEEVTYRYRLRTQEEGEWTNAGMRREAVFSNLKPGSYTFEAQMSFDGITWSNPLLSYSFSIQSPYYQTWWFISFIVLSAAALVYVFVNERAKRLNQKLILENQLINMERKALRLQMNPHFIFNALDSISSFIFKQDPKMAVRYLNNFAKLMRLTLESSMEHLHPVETEVSILKNYLELEQLRFKNKFTYGIEVDEEIDYDVYIPPMLIQPHVENAILHGIKPKEGNGRIDIRFILEGEFLICEIEDDGIGRKAAKELGARKDHRSMATRINKDRIRLLKETLNDDISIEIIDKFEPGGGANGTKVIIQLFAESP